MTEVHPVEKPWQDTIADGYEEVEKPWEDAFTNGYGAGPEVEKPWEDAFTNGYGAGSENSAPSCNHLYENCFCNLIRQPAFLRKLERAAKVQFDWLTFCKELVYHAFFPFTLPLIALWEGGRNGIINRQFWTNRIGAAQWMFSVAFFMVNCLTPLYISPDIVIVDILWLMRSMVLATKYGFISKGEMQEMRERVLPSQTHKDRTLVLAWTNPIPPSVLKKELLLAAIRKDQVRCRAAMHLVPGASQITVQDIMRQLSQKKNTEVKSHSLMQGSGWGSFVDREFGFNQTFSPCPQCVRLGCTKDRFEDTWIKVCLTSLLLEPGMRVPNDALFTESDESSHSPLRSDANVKMSEKACPALDLPAVLLAAYIIQRSGDLLGKRNFLHQVFSNPWRVYWTSSAVGFIHAILPFATRAITGRPSTFGGHKWYHIIVSLSSLIISYSSMSSSVMFMLAGTADFRRRYLNSRLLNTLLKDGWYGEQKQPPKKYVKLREQKFLQQKSVYHLGLAVDFSDPRSVVGWWAVRGLVQDFGLVFHMRVKQYASYFAIYCALLMAFLIVALFANGTRTAIYILTVVVYDLLVFVILLCLMVFPGGATNDMNHEHGATIVRKKMLISSQLDCSDEDMDPEDVVSRKLALEVLNSISGAIYWDNMTTKVTILGFTAGGELMAVLVGFGSAAIGIAAQQLTSRIH